MELPPCGLYQTTGPIGSIEAGRLVYFHNHGDPGPGVYLPSAWKHNRAEFNDKGQTLNDEGLAHLLLPLPAEGFYRVIAEFHCCEKQCRLFEEDALVQLGYNGLAEPILFTPELVDGMLAIPAQGWKTSLETTARLQHLKVRASNRDGRPTQ